MGVIAGVLVIAAIVVALVCCWVRRRKQSLSPLSEKDTDGENCILPLLVKVDLMRKFRFVDCRCRDEVVADIGKLSLCVHQVK